MMVDPEPSGAKLLARQDYLLERLGLPEGTILLRMDIENDGLDQVLTLVVRGPAYPRAPAYGPLVRIPLPMESDSESKDGA